ncbi:gliding motility-associated C-terminal domain-containing protein [Lewinella sp. LCG006]|uniref:T9SS type B sorting domain-containing protein n=1 Tax=Lewinella sp. LCG006 TaxID=3231911 RepID=UPI0034601E51
MRYIVLLLLFLNYGMLSAQTCDGNLGDNIFTEGDFGAGPANVLVPNPNIAPDYFYNAAPPPSDGQYTITNNTGAWGNLYPTWLAIGDNSLNPNGYMMVVNASFEPGLFYDREIDELCGNTLYEFSVDVINLIEVGVPNHIDPNVSFLLDDVVQFTTGEIPKTNSWQTYGFTFTTAPGQTSIRLSLRNNAPGGIGNDLALDNISFRPCGDEAFIEPEEPANICADGQPFPLFATVSGNLYDDPAVQWQISPNGITDWVDITGANEDTYLHSILSSGIYYYRFQIADGFDNLQNEKCRINSNVKEVIVLPTEFSITDTICAGMSYPVGNSMYTTSGLFVDSLINSFGCDSIISTNLTVLPQPNILPIYNASVPDCFNTENGQIEVTEVLNGYPPYDFLWTESGTMSNILTDVPGGNTYNLLITDRYGCQLDTSILLISPDAITLELGADLNIELGDQVSLTANTNFPVSQYIWNSDNANEVLPCAVSPDCPEINWQPTQSQTVFLTTEDANGCAVTDSVFISVTPIYDLYIPNAFSPNLDGVNDYFTVYGKLSRIQSIKSFRVFNRWGQLVYEEADLTPGVPGQGWDGRAKGKIVDQGVYVYALEVVFLDGVVREFSGDVVLVR